MAAELGDYNSIEHVSGYLNSMRLLVEQSEDTEHRISEMHKLHRGQLPADAEYNYLEHAKKLYMYGVDLHKAIVNDLFLFLLAGHLLIFVFFSP